MKMEKEKRRGKNKKSVGVVIEKKTRKKTKKKMTKKRMKKRSEQLCNCCH